MNNARNISMAKAHAKNYGAFSNAVSNQETTTTNGMKARVSTANSCVDLFFKIGASRGKDITPDFVAALAQDPEVALRIAQWARDIRGGAGERQLFRDILLYLDKYAPKTVIKLMPKIPEIGRWDDLLLDFTNREVRDSANAFYAQALIEGNQLAAKWAPRKGAKAVELRKAWGLTPKQYRKWIVSLTNVVETKMCDKDWNSIEFGKIPSLAAARYKTAFWRNAEGAYKRYIDGLVKGTEKINASAVYPYDVLKDIRGVAHQVVEAQWDALPNYMGDANILPMVDVSGSMTCKVGGSANLSCMDVAVSLGLYCADKNSGAFKDLILTFSGNPRLQRLTGNILQKHQQLKNADWGMNTNIVAAFDKVLQVAKQGRVPQSDMPSTIVIFSDMQFDESQRSNSYWSRHEDISSWDESAIEMARRKYADSGYEMPNLVFWNLNAHDNVPVRFDENGTALVSGFSPAIMKSLLQDLASMNPRDIMLKTVMVDRYAL